MSEKKLEAKIVKKAKEFGFLTYKFSSPSNRGVPDRIFISPGGKIFFIEFKSTKGDLSELQKKVIRDMDLHCAVVHMINSFEIGMEILTSCLVKDSNADIWLNTGNA